MPHHTGPQNKTYKRGTDYIRSITGGRVEKVSITGVEHADIVFACRQRQVSDFFTYAEAHARCAAIMFDAYESCSVKRDSAKSLASRHMAAAYKTLVDWQDE